MLHLIQTLIPPPLHRLALRVAHRTRHLWRKLAKPQLAGVSVIGQDGEGRILLVRHSYGPDNWCFPGGGCARGEDPCGAARREIHEELGITAAQLELVETIEETISGAPHSAHVFSALFHEEPKPDRREVVEARFFAVEALPEPISNLARTRLDALLRKTQKQI